MKPGIERRRFRRRPILDSFALFVSLPHKGGHRLPVYDVSDAGLKFDLDAEGESQESFPAQVNTEIEVHFYLNQSLYLPLRTRIVRIESIDSVRRVGVELKDKSGKSYLAFQAFLALIDAVLDEGRLATEN